MSDRSFAVLLSTESTCLVKISFDLAAYQVHNIDGNFYTFTMKCSTKE